MMMMMMTTMTKIIMLIPMASIGGQISIQISTSKSQIFKLQISNLAKHIPILNPTKASQIKSPKLKSQIKSQILMQHDSQIESQHAPNRDLNRIAI